MSDGVQVATWSRVTGLPDLAACTPWNGRVLLWSGFRSFDLHPDQAEQIAHDLIRQAMRLAQCASSARTRAAIGPSL